MKEKLIIKQNKIVLFANEKSKQIVQKAILKVEEFFNQKINFKVIFLETREEMDDLHLEVFGNKHKTDEWVVGGVFKDDTVYIFSEDIYSIVSCHQQKTFFPTLVHEIAHIFIKKLYNFHLPMWLNEGIAYIVAEQDKQPLEKKQDLTKSYTEQEWIQTNPYLTAGKFTRFLFKKYGKDKIFKLMKSLNFFEKEFKKNFKEIYQEEFNTIWNKGYAI